MTFQYAAKSKNFHRKKFSWHVNRKFTSLSAFCDPYPDSLNSTTFKRSKEISSKRAPSEAQWEGNQRLIKKVKRRFIEKTGSNSAAPGFTLKPL
jgi:hypothetical protein